MSFLIADKIDKSYRSVTALTSFSFSVASGEMVALVGPDGAGKTTLIRIICRLVDPDSGTVTIDGQDVFTNYDKVKPQIGYMPQQFSLYTDLSVEENLTFYAGLHGVTGKAFREKRDYLYRFSNLAPFAKRRAGALSGGMKQKLALSCALIHQPKLLILDEPTTGVDPLSRRQFWEMLLDLKKQGVAILASTPYMDEVARCDQAIFIHSGRKLSEGRPDELAASFEGRIYHLDCQPTPQILIGLNDINGLSANRFGSGIHLYLPATDHLDKYQPALATLGIDDHVIAAVPPGLEDRFIQLMEDPA